MFRNLLPLLLGLFLAVAASQVPEFVQQYSQRLGGAVGALRSIVDDFRADAAQNDMTVDEALVSYAATDDGFLQARGIRMSDAIARVGSLSAHAADLDAAGSFGRLWVFFKDNDIAISRSTAQDYQPALPLTFEGLLLSALGFLMGQLGAASLLGLGRRPQARRV